MSETKQCAQCGQTKPIEDFSKSYKNLCKACVAENARIQRHKEKIAESQARGANEAMYGHRLTVATAALQGMLASGKYSTNSPKFLAEKSVEYADALLTEIYKKEE